MGILAAVLLGVLILEVAGVGLLVVWLSERNERRVAAQLAEYSRGQELSQERRNVLAVVAAHGLGDPARLDGMLRDAEALYSVQLGRASVGRFIEAQCKTGSGPSVFGELCAYVESCA